MKRKLTFKGLWQVLKKSLDGFSQHKVTKLSGSLAYYTVFSLGPLLIVIIFLCSFFFGREAVEGRIYENIRSFVGDDTAVQLQEIIKNASVSGKGTIAAVIGFVTLLIGATTVFAEIQDSINGIWGIKPKPKKGWLKMLTNRLLSLSVIASLGFLLLVSLVISGIIDALNARLQAAYPEVTVVVFSIINMAVTLLITSLLFGVIFKVLPDAKIKWKDVLGGAVATGILFIIGKFAISLYISQTSVGSTYGAAGSLVVLLSWVYYSAMILYFGALFTKSYALHYGSTIEPYHYAVATRIIEIEQEGATVNEQHAQAEKAREQQHS